MMFRSVVVRLASTPRGCGRCALSTEILSFERDSKGVERYLVAVNGRRAEVRQAADGRWRTEDGVDVDLGEGDPLRAALSTTHGYAWDDGTAPKWPWRILESLRRAPLVGPGTICLTAQRFAEVVVAEDAAWPVVFPGAAAKLRVPELLALEASAARALEEEKKHGESESAGTLSLKDLLRTRVKRKWAQGGGGDGTGRLIAEHASGELCQVAAGSFWAQVKVAVGYGLVDATIRQRDAAIGVSLAPVTADDRGAEVMEVDDHSAAAREGLVPGMTLTRINGRVVTREPLAAILDAIDEARGRNEDLVLRFATALAAKRYYAVECPVEAIRALAGEGEDRGGDDDVVVKRDDVAIDFFEALDAHAPETRKAFVWREVAPRAFVGDPGSMTCVHADTIPQIQFAHGLYGTKVLGLASADSTDRILDDHASQGDGEDTRMPVHAALSATQAALLRDQGLSLAVLNPGDAVAFYSAQAHFATNGLNSRNAAIYHGALTDQLFQEADAAALGDGIAIRP